MSDDGDAVSTGSEGRRRRYWTKDRKRRILAECLEEGASVAMVARRHGLNANLLFTWRRQFGAEASSDAVEPANVVPMIITRETAPMSASGRMEIVLAGGERVIVGADVEMTALARVVKALSQR